VLALLRHLLSSNSQSDQILVVASAPHEEDQRLRQHLSCHDSLMLERTAEFAYHYQY